MTFFYTLLGDSLLFASIIWFSGYGATGPVTGIRLTIPAKLQLFGEVFVITMVMMYVVITIDQLTGWATQPPWPGDPSPHRLAALGVVLIVGFFYTRRRAAAMHQPLPDQLLQTTPEPTANPTAEPTANQHDDAQR